MTRIASIAAVVLLAGLSLGWKKWVKTGKGGSSIPAQTLFSALTPGQRQSMVLNGTIGTYASTPDSATNSVTGDIDIRAHVSLVDWTPAGTMVLVGKVVNSGNQKSYDFRVTNTGGLQLGLSQDGAVFVGNTPVAHGFSDGELHHVRATFRASDKRVQMFSSADGTTWTQLGADTSINVASIFDSTASLEIGSNNDGSMLRLVGNVYSATVLNGIDGTVAARFGAEDADVNDDAGDTWVTSAASGETWTLNGQAHITNLDLVIEQGVCAGPGVFEDSGPNDDDLSGGATTEASPWSGFGNAAIFDPRGCDCTPTQCAAATCPITCESAHGLRTPSIDTSGMVSGFTIEARLRPKVVTSCSDRNIVRIDGGRSLIFGDPNSFDPTKAGANVICSVGGGGTSTDAGVPSNRFSPGVLYEVACTWDGATARAYVDGTLVASSPAAWTFTDTSARVGIGVDRTSGNGSPYAGAIDEVRISKIARYTGASYTPSVTPFVSDADTVALYHFDEVSACEESESMDFSKSLSGPTCDYKDTEGEAVFNPEADQACANSVLGARTVGSVVNSLCGSETLDDSQAPCDWLGAIAPATVTLDQDDAPLAGSDSLADALSDGSVITSERVSQVVSASAGGFYRASIWMRHASAVTASLEVEANTNPTPTTQTCDVSVGTTYARHQCALDATGLTFTTITVRIYPRTASNATLTGQVFAWGAQLSGADTTDAGGRFLLPYCRSTTTTATTCAGEHINVTGPTFRNAMGAVAWTDTPLDDAPWSIDGGTMLRRSGGGDILRRDQNANTLQLNDDTLGLLLDVSPWATRQTKRIAITWLGATKTIRNITDGTRASNAYDGTFGTDDAIVHFGGNLTFPRSFSYFRDLKIYSRPPISP